MRTKYKEGFSIDYCTELYKKVAEEILKKLDNINKIVSELQFDNKETKTYIFILNDEISIRTICDDVQIIIEENGKRKSNNECSKVEVIKKENFMSKIIELKKANYYYEFSGEYSFKRYNPNLTYSINDVFNLVNLFNCLPLYDSNGNVKFVATITIDSDNCNKNNMFFNIRDDKNNILFREEYTNNSLNLTAKYQCDDYELVSLNEKDYKKIIKFFPGFEVNTVEEKKKKRKYKKDDGFIKYTSISDSVFFDPGKIVKKSFYDLDIIGSYYLSFINFDGANVSNLDFSRNPEININIEKVVRDFTNTSFKGVNLNKQVFKNAILIDTDLRETNATIDIMSCMINNEGKVNRGTIFDESNKFIMGNKKISTEEVRKMGIKVLKK